METGKKSEITKGMKTRKKIYDVALQLFQAHGINQVSVNDIIQKCGISKGTFYIHYKSKYELVKEYVDTLDLNYEEYFESIPKNTSSCRMIDLVTKKTAQVLKDDIGRSVLKNIYEAMLLEDVDSGYILNYGRSLPGIYRDIILKGIREGVFDPAIDVGHITEQLIISIRGMSFEWCICSYDFPFEEKLLEHVNLLIGSIKIK